MVASEVLISHVLLSYSQVVYTFWVQSYNNLLKFASVLQEKCLASFFRCEAFALVVMCDMIRSARPRDRLDRTLNKRSKNLSR